MSRTANICTYFRLNRKVCIQIFFLEEFFFYRFKTNVSSLVYRLSPHCTFRNANGIYFWGWSRRRTSHKQLNIIRSIVFFRFARSSIYLSFVNLLRSSCGSERWTGVRFDDRFDMTTQSPTTFSVYARNFNIYYCLANITILSNENQFHLNCATCQCRTGTAKFIIGAGSVADVAEFWLGESVYIFLSCSKLWPMTRHDADFVFVFVPCCSFVWFTYNSVGFFWIIHFEANKFWLIFIFASPFAMHFFEISFAQRLILVNDRNGISVGCAGCCNCILSFRHYHK